MPKHSELVFSSDSLRKSSDIRWKPKSKLSDYQKMQLRNIKKYARDLEEIETGRKFRMILDYWESESQLPSFPVQTTPTPILTIPLANQSINQSINHLSSSSSIKDRKEGKEKCGGLELVLP
jgi:hypothetical protein